MKKNLFITGGSGFIGRNLINGLKKNFNIFSPGHNQLELINAESVQTYIKKNKIRLIVHCANVGGARDTYSIKNALNINLRLFFNVARNTHLVEKIIHLGSGAEYDKKRDLVNIKESDFDQSVPHDEYGFYKYICAKYIQRSEKFVCLRLFGIYGKYENYKIRFISNSILKNLFGLPITINQNVYFHYLYVDDFVNIVNYFLNKKVNHCIYNVTPGKKIDLISIAKIINKKSDNKSKIIVLKKGLNFEYTGSNYRLMKDFKINFTSYEEGIGRLLSFYKDNLPRFDQEEIAQDKFLKYCSARV